MRHIFIIMAPNFYWKITETDVARHSEIFYSGTEPGQIWVKSFGYLASYAENGKLGWRDVWEGNSHQKKTYSRLI